MKIYIEVIWKYTNIKQFAILPVVVTCPSLTAPVNGGIDCSLGDDGETNPGDTCTFTCDDSYELGDSTSRTCGDDGSWSGTDITCILGMYISCLLQFKKVFLSMYTIETVPQRKQNRSTL